MNFPETNVKQIGLFLLFCLALYFPVFYRLDAIPILMWDESLFSLRALHFLQFGEYMSNFNNFEGMPDHRNTKLPFTTFFQVLGLKIFGVNELGMRLPIAFIFLATVFYTCHYFKKFFNTIYIGYVFGLVMICSTGFVMRHMLRSADQDAAFACYLLLGIMFFYRFIKNGSNSSLALFTIFMIAAFLTKNLLSGIILPGLIAYTLYKRSFIKLLKDYRLYISLFSVIIAYAGTIAYLDSQYPGFFQRMWEFELMGRYSETIDNHKWSWYFYIENFFLKGFNPFGYLLILSVGLTFDTSMKKDVRDLILLSFFTFISYLSIISFSETKTFWYSAPLYPLGALIVSLGSWHLYSYIQGSTRALRLSLLISVLLVLIFPYSDVMKRINNPPPIQKDEKYSLFIDKLAYTRSEIRNFSLTDNNYATSAFFAVQKYNASGQGYNIQFKREIEFKEGEYIMTCLNKVFNPLKEKYNYELIYDRGGDCRLVKIISSKE